jgi:tripartite-type tricarboxylate transporter receptor subunit TctC
MRRNDLQLEATRSSSSDPGFDSISGSRTERIRFRFDIRAAAMAVLTALPALTSGAETYPSRPIRLLVGLPPGAGTDLMARIVASKLPDAIGQHVVVDNRPGAGGLIAAMIAAKASPDGYTLLFGASSYSALFAAIYKKLPYDPVKDFAPISLVAKVPNVLVVNPSFPARTVSEFISEAKASPGKLSYGSSGNGTVLHVAMEMLKKRADINLTHIPYKGGAPAVLDLIAGRIHAMFDNLPTHVAHIKAGRTRPLAITADKRNFQLPEVPTMIEAGLPGFEVWSWYGVFAPAGASRSIVAKLNAAVVKTLNLPEIRQRMALEGVEPMPTTPAEFAAFQKAEIAKWTKAVKESGIEQLE